ncbi:thioredoxin family protein [Microvirga sp. M2]|uniref:thioredoxin family protein n=1 Tax=Microvirga sp. M2 TaxID=3073270 RepID=UPI0039C1E8AF
MLLTFAACLPGLAFVPWRTYAQAARPAFAQITDRKGFDAALGRARAQKKPVLAYFTAEWCPICKSIDARVFSHPVIERRLESIALVRADVTAVDAGSRALMEHLRVPGPPTMFVIDPKDGREMPRTRLTGAVDANLFLDTINLAGL